MMDDLDRRLLELLTDHGRASITWLAGQLGVARATVQERMQRLERDGPVRGYTARLAPEFSRRRISAHVMIAADPKHQGALTRALQKMPAVRALHTISGQYDLIALVQEDSTEALDASIDAIGALEGVERTLSSIVLSTKFER
jgi:DNA-binding Lrp family transcriptional regulator